MIFSPTADSLRAERIASLAAFQVNVDFGLGEGLEHYRDQKDAQPEGAGADIGPAIAADR
jgi:hypothetical protein